jgi:hypothetical protein
MCIHMMYVCSTTIKQKKEIAQTVYTCVLCVQVRLIGTHSCIHVSRDMYARDMYVCM